MATVAYHFFRIFKPILNLAVVKHDRTVIFAFGALPIRPSPVEIKKFLEEKCNLDLKDTYTIQLRTLDDHVAVMFSNASLAAKFVEENQNQTFTTSEGEDLKMPCWIDED